MSIKNDNQKVAFIKNMIQLHLADPANPDAFFSMLLAYDKITTGQGAISSYEVAKIISDVFQQQVDIGDSYKFVSEQWNKA